jgi:hypothetical protein
VQGAQAEGWSFSANVGSHYRGASCASTNEPCEIDDLPSGTRIRVLAHIGGHRCEPKDIDLTAGKNSIVIPCEAERVVQGVLKSVSAGEESERTATIRCSASDRSQKAIGRLFQIRCPERLPSIEYQRAPNGPWMTAPIQSSGPGSTGFVEIL